MSSIKFWGLKAAEPEGLTLNLSLLATSKEELGEGEEDEISLCIHPQWPPGSKEDFFETIADLTIPQALAIAAAIGILVDELRRARP